MSRSTLRSILLLLHGGLSIALPTGDLLDADPTKFALPTGGLLDANPTKKFDGRRLLDDRYPTANTGTCGAQGYEGYVYLGCRADVAGHDNVPNKIKKHIRTVSGCAAACDAEATCKGFLQRDAEGGCYLKSGGWPYTADPNCAFSGSDDFPDPENGLIFYKCDHGVELGKLPAVSSPSPPPFPPPPPCSADSEDASCHVRVSVDSCSYYDIAGHPMPNRKCLTIGRGFWGASIYGECYEEFEQARRPADACFDVEHTFFSKYAHIDQRSFGVLITAAAPGPMTGLEAFENTASGRGNAPATGAGELAAIPTASRDTPPFGATGAPTLDRERSMLRA